MKFFIKYWLLSWTQ